MTTLLDVNEIEKQAQAEMAKEQAEVAINALKELYRKREKAALVLRNIEREIEVYKKDIADNVVYSSAK